jgi:hypothetical protein
MDRHSRTSGTLALRELAPDEVKGDRRAKVWAVFNVKTANRSSSPNHKKSKHEQRGKNRPLRLSRSDWAGRLRRSVLLPSKDGFPIRIYNTYERAIESLTWKGRAKLI